MAAEDEVDVVDRVEVAVVDVEARASMMGLRLCGNITRSRGRHPVLHVDRSCDLALVEYIRTCWRSCRGWVAIGSFHQFRWNLLRMKMASPLRARIITSKTMIAAAAATLKASCD